jgi:hypothetical protein
VRLTCSRSCLQQVLPLLCCGRLLQLRTQHERPAHDKLMPCVAELLLLGLLQQGLQVSLQHLIQQLVHVLRGQVLLYVCVERQVEGVGVAMKGMAAACACPRTASAKHLTCGVACTLRPRVPEHVSCLLEQATQVLPACHIAYMCV